MIFRFNPLIFPFIMSYLKRLKPWAVFTMLPSLQHICVNRFRNRNDAVNYRRLLNQENPHNRYQVIFDHE
jgi:hypothetical protein